MSKFAYSSVGREKRPALRFLLISSLSASLAFTALPSMAVAEAPTTLAAALRDADAGGKDIKAFYKARRYRPLWVQGNQLSPAADSFLRVVETARADGLDPDDYRPRAIADAIERSRGGSPQDLARAEMLLSRSLTSYVRDLRKPRKSDMIYVEKAVMPVRPTARAVLEAAAAAPSLQYHVDNMGWMHPVYAGLRKALASAQPGQSNNRPVPFGPTLRPGDSGYRVHALRDRLGLGEGDIFDPSLANAVKDFQASRGLPVDGIVGPRTLTELNQFAPDRTELLRLNLARARTLPAVHSGRHVLVDVASQRLWMYEGGRVRDSMKVVVGKQTEQTPIMAGLIRYAEVNPYWNIPPDLVRIRVAQGVLEKGPSFLQTKRYELLSDWTNNPRRVDPSMVNWPAVASGRQELRVRQLPGNDNAMGKIKFMFPNELGIYLHDTPEKELFGKNDRRFSSGCVRVEDASRLATWLFGRKVITKKRGPQQHVNLPQPVPVYITYLTAMPEGGRIAYRSDIYQRDARQLASRD